jgi:hypothetical protein
MGRSRGFSSRAQSRTEFPDGRHLLWSGCGWRRRRYVEDIDSGRAVNLTPILQDDYNPAISDGATIASSPRQPKGVYLMASSGGAARRIGGATGGPRSAGPDGQSLLLGEQWSARVSGPLTYYSRLGSSHRREGGTLSGRDAPIHPECAAGRRIAFLSRTGGQSDLWTSAGDGSDAHADGCSAESSPDMPRTEGHLLRERPR